MDVFITTTFVGWEVDREERTGAAKTADTLIKARARKGNNIPGVDANMWKLIYNYYRDTRYCDVRYSEL